MQLGIVDAAKAHPYAALASAVVVGAAAYVYFFYSSSSRGDKDDANDFLSKPVGGQQLPPQGAESLLGRLIVDISKDQFADAYKAAAGSSGSGLFRKKAKVNINKNGSLVINFSRETMQLYFAAAASEDATLSASATLRAITDNHNMNVLRETAIRLATEFELLEKDRKTSFNDKDSSHVDLLQRLWRRFVAPSEEFQRHSDRWDVIGFQGRDPATDLRAGGILALKLFVNFAESNPEFVDAMLKHCKAEQESGGLNWLLIACASVNVTVTLMMQRAPARQEQTFPLQFLSSVYRGALFADASDVAAARAERQSQTRTSTGLATSAGSAAAAAAATTSSSAEETSLYRAFVPEDLQSGRAKLMRPADDAEGAFSLFASLCRIHHHLMRKMWTEFAVDGKVSVMEFESFMTNKIYAKYIFNDSGEALVL